MFIKQTLNAFQLKNTSMLTLYFTCICTIPLYATMHDNVLHLESLTIDEYSQSRQSQNIKDTPRNQNLLGLHDNTFKHYNRSYTISISKMAIQGMMIEKYHNYQYYDYLPLRLSFPNKNEAKWTIKGEQITYNTILYTEYLNNIDIAIKTDQDSLEISTILKDADTPREYKYKLHAPSGGEIKKLKDGGIIITHADNMLYAGFTPPSATDKYGKKIPTHYKIEGDYLIQVIEHTNMSVSYPVIANFYVGKDMISHSRWERVRVNNRWDWGLAVYPTKWAQVYKGNAELGEYGYEELLQNRQIYFHSKSIKNQYICNQEQATKRQVYHIEEWRPNVGYKSTIRANCDV